MLPPFHPIVINFLSHKGGGGRTTSAMSIAAALVLQARNVLVVDMDFEAPGLTLFNGNGEEGDWIRLGPDTLRALALGKEWRPPDPDAGRIPLAGLNEVLAEALIARSGGDVLLVNRRGNFRDNLDRATGWWQSGPRSRAEDAPAVEAAIADRVASGRHIYEYVPIDGANGGSLRLPGRLFVLPFGGHFRRRPPFWIYHSDSMLPDNVEDDRADAWADLLKEDLTRELARRHVNLTTALVGGAGRILRKQGVRLDAVLIDHRPGADLASHRLGTVGHGTIFVTSAARGALASTWQVAEKLTQLCINDIKAEKRGVAPVAGFMVEKITSGGAGQAQDPQFGEPFRSTVRAVGVDAALKHLAGEDLVSEHVAAFRRPLRGSGWRASLQFALAPLAGGRIGLASGVQPSGPESVLAAWRATNLHRGASDLENVFESLVPVLYDEEGFPFYERTHDIARWSLRANVRTVAESTDTTGFNAGMFSLVASGLRDLATEKELGRFLYFEDHPPSDPAWEVVRALGHFHSNQNVEDLDRVVRKFADEASKKPPSGADWTLPYHLAEACLLLSVQDPRSRADHADRARELCERALEWFEASHVTTQYAEARWAIEALAAQAQMAWAEAGGRTQEEIFNAFGVALNKITQILRDDRERDKDDREGSKDDREGNNASITWILRPLPRQTTASAQTILRDDRRQRLFRVSLSWVNALFSETGSLHTACGLDEPSPVERHLQALYPALEAWAAASGLPTPSAPIASLDAYLDLGDSTYAGLADLAELARAWLNIDLFAGLGIALAESISRAADEHWPQLQRLPRIRARLLPLLVVQGWSGRPDFDDLTRKTHDVERVTQLAHKDSRRGRVAAIWCGIALMELAQERAASEALDAALDFSRRAATQFSHAAQGSTRPDVWFLLMAARAFARFVTEEQRRRRLLNVSEAEQKRDAFLARLAKAVRTLDRDAFYAFEQWEALRLTRISESGKINANRASHPINHYFEGSAAAVLSKVPYHVIREISEGLHTHFSSANGRTVFRALPGRIRSWMETAWDLVKDRRGDDRAYASAKNAWLNYR